MIAVVLYLLVIVIISLWVGRDKSSSSDFFNGGRKSPWYLVALGMVSASVSGISVVSVPGMVGGAAFTYMQMVFGFILGYVVVAYLLLPMYYRLNLTSIYGYLEQRFGPVTHRVGGLFFIVYKMVAAASKLYLVLIVLQFLILDSLNIPFACYFRFSEYTVRLFGCCVCAFYFCLYLPYWYTHPSVDRCLPDGVYGVVVGDNYGLCAF